MPKVIFICGPNGAGKSTLTRTVAMQNNFIVLDPDRFAAQGLSLIAAGRAAITLARQCIGLGVSFMRESTLSSHLDLALMREAKERGYRVELLYISLCAPELAVERVATRAARGGHDVPVADIIRRFHRSHANLARAREIADVTQVLDNSQETYCRR